MKQFQKILAIISLLQILYLPVYTFAQPNTQTPGVTVNPTTVSSVKFNNPFKYGGDLMNLLQVILNNIILPVASVIVVLYIIYAGFTFVTAQGKPAEIQKAQQRLLWALIGAGILLGAGAISHVVQNTIHQVIQP
jgi:hypothetical protein